MAKTIEFQHEGISYKLEFTRESVKTMERQGFNIRALADAPMSVLPQLWAGAFIAHHRGTKRSVIEDIYNHMSDKGNLLEALCEMYNEPLDTLMAEPDDGKNISWAQSW